jgi:hypothetical protein
MDAPFSKLTLEWRTYESDYGADFDYLYFVVGGKSLREVLNCGDYIGCLGWPGCIAAASNAHWKVRIQNSISSLKARQMSLQSL